MLDAPFQSGQARVPIGVKPARMVVMPIHEMGNDLDTGDYWPVAIAAAEQQFQIHMHPSKHIFNQLLMD